MDIRVELDGTTTIFLKLLAAFVTVISHSGAVLAADTCSFHQGTTTVVAYCEDGCCDNNCCTTASSTVDVVVVLVILGVIAGIVAIALVFALICCIKGRQKDKTRDLVLTQRNSAKVYPAVPERPKLYRENAIFINNSSKHPSPSLSVKKITAVSKHETMYTGDLRQSGNIKNFRIRLTKPNLPHVLEIEDFEEESAV